MKFHFIGSFHRAAEKNDELKIFENVSRTTAAIVYGNCEPLLGLIF